MLHAFTVAILTSTLVLSTGFTGKAWAAPKTIAVVNLSKSPQAYQTAQKARQMLERMEELRPNTSGDLALALEDLLPKGGVDAPILKEAEEALNAGKNNFTAFQDRKAHSDLAKARTLLFGIAPNERTNELLADISFQMALIHLREENNGLAMGELRLMHRLSQRDTIDPVRYPPDVVKAFQRAKSQIKKGAQDTQLRISATYDGASVFINGKKVGVTPLDTKVRPGVHIVAVAAPEYQPAAQHLNLGPGQQEVKISLEARSPVVRALELRFKAKNEGLGTEELKRAAREVSRLVGSDAVLLLVDNEKAKMAQTRDRQASDSEVAQQKMAPMPPVATLYIQHLDRLTYQHPVDKKLKNMLALMVPVDRPTLLDGTGRVPTPWYRETSTIIGLVGGTTAIAAIAVAGLLTLGGENPQETTRNGLTEWQF
jgi:hypothetical protein